MSPYSRYFEKIRIRPDDKVRAEAGAPVCQWDGCKEPGTHRAPVGRQREGEYFRFCLEHVRHYNKNFNYFSGAPDEEIARFQKEALIGHRPTWKMGAGGQARYTADFSRLRSGSAAYYSRVGDPFNLFNTEAPAAPAVRKLKVLEARAIETLGLAENATGAEIKARYKELVKRHHPDTNGGNRGSEDRFRDVVQAYRLLRQAGLC